MYDKHAEFNPPPLPPQKDKWQILCAVGRHRAHHAGCHAGGGSERQLHRREAHAAAPGGGHKQSAKMTNWTLSVKCVDWTLLGTPSRYQLVEEDYVQVWTKRQTQFMSPWKQNGRPPVRFTALVLHWFLCILSCWTCVWDSVNWTQLWWLLIFSNPIHFCNLLLMDSLIQIFFIFLLLICCNMLYL